MRLFVAFGAVAIISAVPGAGGATQAPALELRGFAINILGVGSGRSGDVEIRIDRWSTAEETGRLRQALAEGGSAGLGTALHDGPAVGLAHTQRGGDLPLLFAAESSLPDGGRRILLATAPIHGQDDSEVTSPEYLIVELRLGSDGKGEGRAASPSQISWDATLQVPVIDRYTAQPVWINRVEVVRD